MKGVACALLGCVLHVLGTDPLRSEFSKLDGNWGIVKQAQLSEQPMVPLVVCGAKPDQHKGVLRGKVLSGLTKQPLSGVVISYAHSRGRCETSTDRSGEYLIAVEAWASGAGSAKRKIRYSREGYEQADAFYHVLVGRSTWVEAVALVPEYSTGMRLGGISGLMRSASSGRIISPVCSCSECGKPSVLLRRGAHSKDTRVITKATPKNGRFYFRRLRPGVYTVEMKASCFIPRLATLVVLSGRIATLSKSIFLVPKFVMRDKPRLRFLLTWGRLPLDLDLHLLVPQEQGGVRGLWMEVAASQSVGHRGNFAHRMYNSKHLKIYYGAHGSITQQPFSELTINSTRGFGPEEILVHKAVPGTYMLYVRKKGQDVSLEHSEASVEIYKNNDLLETVRIKAHGASLTKKTWNVLTFEGGSLVPDLDGFDHFHYEVLNKIEHREPPKAAFS